MKRGTWKGNVEKRNMERKCRREEHGVEGRRKEHGEDM